MAPLSLRVTRLLLVPCALVALPLLAAPAMAQDPDPTAEPSPPPAEQGDGAAAGPCLVTGYLAGPDQELSSLLDDLDSETVHALDGSRLEPGQTWVIPDGHEPVVVVDSTEPLTRGAVLVTVAGQEREVSRESFEESRHRYVTRMSLPQLRDTVRTLGMTVQSPPCPEVQLTLSMDRSVWSTLVGRAGIAATALFGLLLVLVARMRKGGWLRRFGFAAPFGLLAGAGQGAVLLEAEVVSPFAMPPWWLTLFGLALAAALPLTRWWRRREPTEAAFPVPPAVAPLGGYQVGDGLARTETSVIYRATRPAPPPAEPAPEPEPGPPPAEESPAAPLPVEQPLADQAAAGPDPAGTPNEVPAGESSASEPSASESPAAAAPVGPPPAPPIPEPALVKVAADPRYAEPVVRMRLEREAQVLAGLAHPNVLALREVFASPAGPPTLVFEYVDGVPLRPLLAARGSMSGPQVVNVVLGALAGLGAVHDRGLVHRDVRPENLWLDTRGGVLLAGFELACAGAEHPVAPDGVVPYASPEQRYGRVLDERSDLWACGVLLAELLTGRVPARALDLSLPPDPASLAAGLPEPLAALLARVLADDPAARPASAEQFATELRAAAEAAFGPGWAERGMLAGALVADGATGTGAPGYVLAGPAAGDPPAVTGPASGTRPPKVRTGTPGPVIAVVNSGIAACVAAGVTATVLLVNPEPVEAQAAELIDPELARAVFVRTVDEGWDRVYIHFRNDAEVTFDRLIEREAAAVNEPLADVVVGVPPDQFEYPAWFLASAVIPHEGGEVSIVARFDRASEHRPWTISEFSWSAEELLPGPLLDGDWLAPMPEPGDLLVDPQDLPGMYADWLARAFERGRVAPDAVLTLRDGSSPLMDLVTSGRLPNWQGEEPRYLTVDWKFTADDVVTGEDDLIPLASGAVQLRFQALATFTVRYTRGVRGLVCDPLHLRWGPDPPRYRSLTADLPVTVDAWVPIPDLVPEPETEEGPGLVLEPADPEAVLLEEIPFAEDDYRDLRGARC